MSTLAAAPAQVTPGSKKDQIMQLLKSGCRPGEAALAVGCDPSYVSQCLEESSFSNELVEWKVKQYQEVQARDGKYDSLEDRALEALTMKLDSQGFMMKTETLLRTIQTLNGAKRRGMVGHAEVAPIQNVINLTLPSILVQRYQVNSQNEVMSVGSQELITMPAQSILEKVQARKLAAESSGGAAYTGGTGANKNNKDNSEYKDANVAPPSAARLYDDKAERLPKSGQDYIGQLGNRESDLERRVAEATLSAETV